MTYDILAVWLTGAPVVWEQMIWSKLLLVVTQTQKCAYQSPVCQTLFIAHVFTLFSDQCICICETSQRTLFLR